MSSLLTEKTKKGEYEEVSPIHGQTVNVILKCFEPIMCDLKWVHNDIENQITTNTNARAKFTKKLSA
jgi:hypothetical protein